LIGLSETVLAGTSAVELRVAATRLGAGAASTPVIARDFTTLNRLWCRRPNAVPRRKATRLGLLGRMMTCEIGSLVVATHGLNIDEGIRDIRGRPRHHAQRLGVAYGKKLENAGMVRIEASIASARDG